MGEHLSETNQKERRDQFFCQLARRHLYGGESNKDGWMAVPEAEGLSVRDDKSEIQNFLERLAEDGWVELKDVAGPSGVRARLTSAGTARAKVICREGLG